jgi:general secretion pathway protein C
MDVFFRKYFWTVHLVFIFFVASIAARTINLFIESSILPLPKEEIGGASVRRPPLPPSARLDLERLAKLSGLPIPKEDPMVQEPERRVDPNAPPVKTTLRVKLLGTLAAEIGDWSMASIQDTSTLRAQTYGIGDQIQGAEVLEIQRERVIILHDRRREYIGNDPTDVAAATPARLGPTVSEAAPPSVAVGTGIRAVSDNEYEVPRAEIDKTMSNLNDVAMQARIVPAFKDGQAQGFKLFSIRPDSLYTKIGIQNGDVIRRINGYDLNSPEKALEIYTKLKDTSRIDIELDRNGQPVRKTYNVR